jgi:excisionase family DNA binding protein
MKQTNKLLTTEEVAQMFGVHERTVRTWVKAGLLKDIKIGHRTCRYSMNDVQLLLNSH